MRVTIKNVGTIEPYAGEHAIPGIRFRAARQALGLSSFGMNVIDLSPNNTGHPEHDHQHDGQEEVYLVLEGSIVLIADGAEHVLNKGDLVRVPAEVTRKLVTRAQGATILALGATPGRPYEPDRRMATT